MVLLQVISENSGTRDPNLQAKTILYAVADRLGVRGKHDQEEAIPTLFHDLFRTGLLSEGYNIDNPTLPWFHLSARGRETLKHASRDPANPDGYLVSSDRKPARNSGRMLSVPLSHFRVRPSPLEQMGVEVVVLLPREGHLHRPRYNRCTQFLGSSRSVRRSRRLPRCLATCRPKTRFRLKKRNASQTAADHWDTTGIRPTSIQHRGCET